MIDGQLNVHQIPKFLEHNDYLLKRYTDIVVLLLKCSYKNRDFDFARLKCTVPQSDNLYINKDNHQKLVHNI